MSTTRDRDARRLAHASFTLTRDYPVPVERLWAAFAEEDQKRSWYGDPTAFERGEWRFDFRVGGRDVAEGTFHDGPVSRYVATYADIVECVRIVTTYDMWIDGAHMSTSVASYELEPTGEGSRLTHTEHGIFLDRHWSHGPHREAGSRELLELLAAHLSVGP